MSLKLERAPEVKPELPFKFTLLNIFVNTDLNLKENFKNFETGSTPLRPEVPFKFTDLSFSINF